MNDSCIFCKIVAGKLPAKKIKETKTVLVFADINPRARVHYLVIPKKHIVNLLTLEPEDHDLCADLLFMCQELGLEQPEHDFNLAVNNGKKAGQIVDHLHLHFLVGTKIKVTPESSTDAL